MAAASGHHAAPLPLSGMPQLFRAAARHGRYPSTLAGRGRTIGSLGAFGGVSRPGGRATSCGHPVPVGCGCCGLGSFVADGPGEQGSGRAAWAGACCFVNFACGCRGGGESFLRVVGAAGHHRAVIGRQPGICRARSSVCPRGPRVFGARGSEHGRRIGCRGARIPAPSLALGRGYRCYHSVIGSSWGASRLEPCLPGNLIVVARATFSYRWRRFGRWVCARVGAVAQPAYVSCGIGARNFRLAAPITDDNWARCLLAHGAPVM